MWNREADLLCNAGRRVFLPDLPGFGLSPFKADYSLADVADAVVDCLKLHGVDAADFIGLSMGGYVLFEICRRAPTAVLSAVFCDTSARADTDKKKKSRSELAGLVSANGSAVLVEAMLPALLSDTSKRERPELVTTLADWIAGADPTAIVEAQKALANRRSSLDLLPAIRSRCLVIVGEDDCVTDVAVAKEIAGSIPEAAFRLIPRAGHFSNLEQPEVFYDAITAFYEDIDRSEPGYH